MAQQPKSSPEAEIVKELAPYKAKISKAVIAAEELIIKEKDDLQGATVLLGNIKMVGKAITSKKFTITKPLNEALRNARDFFRPLESQYQEAEDIVKTKMIDFQTAETIKADAKTKKIEEKVESGKMSMDKAADKIEEVTPQKNITTDEGAAQFRTIKEVLIIDETKIPREYLVPDMVKIKKVALAGVEIPGVEVKDKQVVAGITKI